LGGGIEDAAGLPRHGAAMQLARLQRSVYSDASPANLVRYHAASKVLEKSCEGPTARPTRLERPVR